MIQNRVTMGQEIVKVQGEAIKRAEDELLLEHALSLEYGGEKIPFFCTELLLRELAVGYVFSAFGRNLGKERYLLESVVPGHTELRFLGEGALEAPFGRAQDFTVEAEWILKAMESFSKRSELFLRTGNVHSAAFLPRKQKGRGQEFQYALYAEDIGRHNALDKLIGLALVQDIDLSDGVVLLSGRAPSDMVKKLMSAGVKMAVSVSAPTYDSVRLAQAAGITLIGFARGSRMNIYSNAYRVTGKEREVFHADEKRDFFK